MICPAATAVSMDAAEVMPLFGGMASCDAMNLCYFVAMAVPLLGGTASCLMNIVARIIQKLLMEGVMPLFGGIASSVAILIASKVLTSLTVTVVPWFGGTASGAAKIRYATR